MDDELDLISHERDPAAWAALLHQLQDAHVHLGELLMQMNIDNQVDEIELGIQLGHIYGHLNRAWNGRHLSGDADDEWYSKEICSFPDEIQIT